MRIQKYPKFKTFSNTLSAVSASIPSALIFALDSLSLILFAMGILGIIDTFPATVCLIIQSAFIAITSLLTLYFLYSRIYYMAILKLAMLIILYAIDIHVYYI